MRERRVIMIITIKQMRRRHGNPVEQRFVISGTSGFPDIGTDRLKETI